MQMAKTGLLQCQQISCMKILGALFFALIFFSCNRSDEQVIRGKVTYDYVRALPASLGGVRLDYANTVARPARRIKVLLVAPSGEVMDEVYTNDNGVYRAKTVLKKFNIWVVASTGAKKAKPDSIAPDHCNGASWDVEVVDNTNSFALYAALFEGYDAENSDSFDIHLKNDSGSSVLSGRVAAPFAILDSILTEVEMICEAYAGQRFPPLQVGWSVYNTYSNSYRVESGQIGSSHYINSGTPHIYILGHKGVDTDEYDRHVIAHEFAHYLEDQLYRSDSIGGMHSFPDTLDPRVAFSEGFANAMSGITFQNPTYVDTSGANESSGFDFDVSLPVPFAATPNSIEVSNIYSEFSTSFLIWNLYENRDALNHSGDFIRIGEVLNLLKNSEALITLQGFAAIYNSLFGGTAESLQTLWQNSLFMPYDSLCIGACIGSGDVADELDTDNDIGVAMTGAAYPPLSGQMHTAGFWRLYQPLSRGSVLSGEHELLDLSLSVWGGSHTEYFYNKLGSHRLYYLRGDGLPVTVSIDSNSLSCNSDLLDLFVIAGGSYIDYDLAFDGCPQVRFDTKANALYVIDALFASEYGLSYTYSYTISAN